MKSSGMAKKAVLQDSQSSSRCFGFILQASSFILPEICSILFMSDDWAGQSWSTLTFSTFTDFGVEAEVWERAPSCWRICSLVVWNVMGSKNFLILRAVDVARSCRSLAHPHAGCNPKPWFFLPWTELFSGWILGPCRFQQVFCSISGDWDAVQSMIHQKNRPSATFPLSILSTSCRPWQMQHDSFGVFCFCFCWYVSSNSATETTAWGSLTNCFVDTGVSGDQFSRSSAAAEKGLTLDCRSNKRSSRTAILLGLSWTSPVSSKSFYLCHLTFGYIGDICHLSSRLGRQPLDDQHFGLWLNLWHAVRGSHEGLVLWGSFYTHPGMC